MSILKKLASETAIYGISSIVGRVLFFLLTPLYVSVFESSQEYGKYADIYAIVAFLTILFGYGMETAFFRYSLKEQGREKISFGTALSSVSLTSILLGALILLAATPIAKVLQVDAYQHLFQLGVVIVVLDSLTSIPFAQLRAKNRPIRFATIKLLGIGLNIGLNLFFYLACPKIMAEGNGALYNWVSTWYNPSFGVGYALVANVADAAFKLLLLSPLFSGLSWGFSQKLWGQMLRFGWPIMVVSLAGMVNEVADRQLLKWMLPKDDGYNLSQLGIYSACYKLSIFLSLFTQAFRYAGEPFFFAQAKEKDAPETYARVLKYFTIFSLVGFLTVTLYIDVFKYFIPREEYWVGLTIIPVLLMAYVFYGVYYNLSVWYKLTDQTFSGSIIAIFGAIITLAVNILFIPKYGYWASTWATFLAFGCMSLLSYFWGRRHFPVPYDWKRLLAYLGLAVVICALFLVLNNHFGMKTVPIIFVNSVGLLLFVAVVLRIEREELKALFNQTN
ncbi:MAG: oligosaccharide flippase family protein [Saprospiraceae bacterium]|nr:oligosaccharide flippase family protein [Saprospiraceae bacterium]